MSDPTTMPTVLVDAGPRLLVVDDEPSICELISDVANMVGFVAQSASTAEEIDRLLGADFDVIVLDLALIGSDGIAVMKTLASRAPGARVVLASGASERIIASATRVAQLYGLQVLGTMPKPLGLSSLRTLLRDCRDAVVKPALVLRQRPDVNTIIDDLVPSQLHVLYQPIANVADGTVRSAEALVRWRHPEHGLIPPDQFVPALERLGRQHDLLLHVARQVAEDRMSVPGVADLDDVSINVSALDLNVPETPDELLSILGRAAPASAWTLEITETVADGVAVTALDVMTRLGLAQFKLAIDDYGTGSSTLDRLRWYPFTTLKIDREFVSANPINNLNDWIIVENAVLLGHQLGLTVTAEGVETSLVFERLRALGVDKVQGYLVSEPVPALELSSRCLRWSTTRVTGMALY
jgi:EAL domain-containing protein (putative c-di-GMP-specific phosphodiesterase class I)